LEARLLSVEHLDEEEMISNVLKAAGLGREYRIARMAIVETKLLELQ
jgi:predicted nuclease with TOPRIM domain